MNKFIPHTPPTVADWGPMSQENFDDWDLIYAFKLCVGKTNDEILHQLVSRVWGVSGFVENLLYMTEKPFLYYVFTLKMFIETESQLAYEYPTIILPGAISELITLFDEKSLTNPEQIEQLYTDFFPFLKNLADKQADYDVSEEFYGNFKEQVDVIFKRFPHLSWE